MSAFREHLLKALRHYLESEDCRHVGNDRDSFLFNSDENHESDRALLRGPLPSFDDVMRMRQGVIDEEERRKAWLYDRLANEASRGLLVTLSSFAVLGRLFVRFPFMREDTPSHAESLHRRCLCAEEPDDIRNRYQAAVFINGTQPLLYDVSPLGLPARLYCSRPFVYALDRGHDYRYAAAGMTIDVEPGDVVLDCGAAHGDTALLFAHKAGESGAVIAFEPNPYMALVLYDNLAMNPALAARILVHEKALGPRPGGTVPLTLAGGASSTAGYDNGADESVDAEISSIDACAAELGLRKIDMIKMDIEGTELGALQGAVKTLVRFRPKLALCVYHKPEDVEAIPRFIHELGLGYRFYLDHHSPTLHETVLFAISSPS